jgi:SAM-dependent methyltransferase
MSCDAASAGDLKRELASRVHWLGWAIATFGGLVCVERFIAELACWSVGPVPWASMMPFAILGGLVAMLGWAWACAVVGKKNAQARHRLWLRAFVVLCLFLAFGVTAILVQFLGASLSEVAWDPKSQSFLSDIGLELPPAPRAASEVFKDFVWLACLSLLPWRVREGLRPSRSFSSRQVAVIGFIAVIVGVLLVPLALNQATVHHGSRAIFWHTTVHTDLFLLALVGTFALVSWSWPIVKAGALGGMDKLQRRDFAAAAGSNIARVPSRAADTPDESHPNAARDLFLAAFNPARRASPGGQPPFRLLDAGGGCGDVGLRIVKELGKLDGRPVEYTLLDPAAASLQAATQAFRRGLNIDIRVVVGRLEESDKVLQVVPQPFDAILICQAIQFLEPDPPIPGHQRAFQVLGKRLAPGGALLVIDEFPQQAPLDDIRERADILLPMRSVSEADLVWWAKAGSLVLEAVGRAQLKGRQSTTYHPPLTALLFRPSDGSYRFPLPLYEGKYAQGRCETCWWGSLKDAITDAAAGRPWQPPGTDPQSSQESVQ